MENEWRFVPFSRDGKVPKDHQSSLGELSKFNRQTEKKELMETLLNSDYFAETFDMWKDFDYEQAFNYLETLDDETRKKLTTKMLKKLKNKSFQELVFLGGRKAIKDAFTYIHDNYPDLFSFVLQAWPEAENFIG